MARLLPIVLIAIAAAAQVAAEPATRQPDSLGAEWRQQQVEARAKVKSGGVAPLERVVRELRRRRPGRLLDAGLETDPDGRTVYRVRWAAADGRRVDFRVDATTGAVLSEH
jgi:uncharacterized membrane protein YkoI